MSEHKNPCDKMPKETKPSWWPENPYPMASIFSGAAWDKCSDACARAVKEREEWIIEQIKELKDHCPVWRGDLWNLISKLKEKP